MTSTAHQRFIQMANRPEPEVELAEAALLIALEERPDLRPEEYIERLDQWAAILRPRLNYATAPEHFVSHLNRFLFEELGFQGNLEEYYDPRNSFLDQVMDRRLGIPITLSILYIELARRIAFNVEGVGMPGHFLVKPALRDAVFYVDPFNRGQILNEADCAQRLEEMYGGTLTFQKSFLAPVGRKQILTRLLYNLKAIYIQTEQIQKALMIIDKILSLLPEAPTELRDRGMLHCRLGRLEQAIIDLQKYLLYSPQARDAAEVRRTILKLQRQLRKQDSETS